jgi:hypothetical protein
MQTNLGNAIMYFLGSCHPSHNWWEMSTSNPPICVERKMNGAWVTKFCAVNPCALMFAILWCSWLVMCFLWNLNMCVNKQRFDGGVWRINMRYIYSYIIIYVYIHVCRRMEAVENSPKAYVGFAHVFYAYVLLSSCLLALYVSRTMLSWACARCLTFLASHLPNYWSAALFLKDPSNYKFCVSLLMLVYSLKESEGMSGFQNLPGVESYSPSMFGYVSKMRRL